MVSSQDGPAGRVRLAAAQVGSVWLDREKTVAKACDVIREAGRNGARVIGFPENYIPGHPSWLHFELGTAPKSLALARRLFEQSVEVPGPDIDLLSAAAADAGVVVVMGLTERRPQTLGTLFNSQVVIDSDGAYLGKHQKLVPTITERLVHAPGGRDTQHTVRTSIGAVGNLICGENSNPLALAHVGAAYPSVHVASWPEFFGPSFDMRETCSFVTRGVAYMNKSFVIAACGVPSDEELADFLPADVDRDALLRASGGSMIVSPSGRIVAGPMAPNEEGILYADVDLGDCITGRSVHDYSGHYTRADFFHLSVNSSADDLFTDSRNPSLPVINDPDGLAATSSTSGGDAA